MIAFEAYILIEFDVNFMFNYVRQNTTNTNITKSICKGEFGSKIIDSIVYCKKLKPLIILVSRYTAQVAG